MTSKVNKVALNFESSYFITTVHCNSELGRKGNKQVSSVMKYGFVFRASCFGCFGYHSNECLFDTPFSTHLTILTYFPCVLLTLKKKDFFDKMVDKRYFLKIMNPFFTSLCFIDFEKETFFMYTCLLNVLF